MKLFLAIGVALASVFAGRGHSDEPSLREKLVPLLRAHKGKVAVSVRHVKTGERFDRRADEPMPTASLIKVAVLVEFYLQADAKKFALSDKVVLRDEDKVPGSGILTKHFSAGTSLFLRDAAHLMISHSDNTATNLVLDKVGLEAVNARMKSWGYPNTRILAKVYKGSTTSIDPAATKKFGLGVTTAKEMTDLFTEILTSERLRPALKQSVLGEFKGTPTDSPFRKDLPRSATVAQKGGAVSSARTAAGILYTKSGPVIVTVLTAENEDKRWHPDNAGDRLCAKVARIVWDHYNRGKDVPSASPLRTHP